MPNTAEINRCSILYSVVLCCNSSLREGRESCSMSTRMERHWEMQHHRLLKQTGNGLSGIFEQRCCLWVCFIFSYRTATGRRHLHLQPSSHSSVFATTLITLSICVHTAPCSLCVSAIDACLTAGNSVFLTSAVVALKNSGRPTRYGSRSSLNCDNTVCLFFPFPI